MAKHLKKTDAPKRSAIIFGSIAGIVLVLVLAVVVSAGVLAQRNGTVFPGVRFSGVDVSGKNYEEAVSLLSKPEHAALFGGTVSVGLSDNVVLVVSGRDAGLAATPEAAARMALDFGRGGGFLAGAFAYIKSVAFGTKLSVAGLEDFDEAAVRALVRQAAERVNAEATKDAYYIEDETLFVYKGERGSHLDEDAVFDLIYSAFENGSYELIQYVPDGAEEHGLDLQTVYDEIYAEPVAAYYDKATDAIVPETVGLGFDVAAAQRRFDAAAYGETVEIALTVMEPEDTEASLTELLFRDVLSEKATAMYTSSANRITNITLAAAAINGTVLMPDDEFSFNGIVGERTAAKGYKMAGAYVGGQSVDQIGGGICQVSSTIYYCTLMADLKVTNRANHMFSVAYLPLGMDATVNWGTIDYKFKNDTDYPIRIIAFVKDKQLFIELHGTKTDDRTVKLQYELLSTTPFLTVEEVDETMAPGTSKVKSSGHTGYVVNAYKYIYDGDGQLIDTIFLSKDTYRKADKIVLVPPPTDPGTTDPGTTDPGTTDPGTTDPGTTDPGTTDPGTTDPDPAEPSNGSGILD